MSVTNGRSSFITKSEIIEMVVVAQLTLLSRRFVQVEVFGGLKNQLSNRGPSLLMLLTVACFVILILLLHDLGGCISKRCWVQLDLSTV